MNNRIKKIIKFIIVCILIAIPALFIKNARNSLEVQNTAKRWDNTGKSAFVSTFISKDAKINETNLLELEEQIKQTLSESDALGDGNVYTYAYSSKSSVTVSSEKGTKQVTGYGVGGNFFMFHPLELLSGAYFNPEEQAHDLVVLDEDVAWELFGSANVEGMEVEINGIPHVVSGVINRDEGSLYKLAGNNQPSIYMSYMSLKNVTEDLSVTCYEAVIPNLTKDYAKKIIKKYFCGDSGEFGGDIESTGIGNDEIEIIENSKRFELLELFGSLKAFAGRTMKKTTVSYPYWENVARGVESICCIMLLVEIILLIYAVIKIICFIRRFVKKRTRKIKAEAVIFDIGNVLAEFIPEEFLRRLKFSEDKIELLMENVIESDIWNEYDKGIMTKEEAIERFIEKSPDLEADIRKVFINLNGIVKRFTFSDIWIEDLKNRGKKVYYLSNISDALYHDCKSELNFTEETDGGVLSFEEKCSKPDKKIYEILIEKYNLNPEKCVFIDDRQANVEAARELGFNAVLFTNYLEVNKELNKKFL